MPKMIERGFFSAEIKLSDPKAGMPAAIDPAVQILRVGAFNHPKYGEFQITALILAEMKSNFDSGIRGIDIALDYFHDSDKEASGWLKSLELREDGTELWGEVDWTPKARKMLSEREVRYFSPDFAFEWTDPETEKTYQNVLFGGGLTNRPFVKDMAAIVASEKKGETMTLAELEKMVLKLSEGNSDLAAKHAELQKAHADLLEKHGALQKKLDDADADEDEDDDSSDDEPKDLDSAKKMLGEMKAKLAEYAENAKKAEEAKQMAEKKSKFQVMLTEGKACAAQEAAFMKGDMEEFVKLSEPVNLGGKGHGGGSKEGGAKGDRDDRVLKLAEEKVKADPKLKMHDAIVLANKEVKE